MKKVWFSYIYNIHIRQLDAEKCKIENSPLLYDSLLECFVGSFMYSNIRWSWRFAVVVQREGKREFGENFLALTKYTFGKGVERNKITWKRRGWDKILSLCIYRCVSDSLRLLRRMLQTPFLSKTQLSNA